MVDCKGLCSDSCGPVPASSLERRLIAQRRGPLGSQGNLCCSMLLPNGMCGVYSIRPLICRVWGAAEGLPCTHGCKPERVLTVDEVKELVAEVNALSGDGHRDSVYHMLNQLTPEERHRWEKFNAGWQKKWNAIELPQEEKTSGA